MQYLIQIKLPQAMRTAANSLAAWIVIVKQAVTALLDCSMMVYTPIDQVGDLIWREDVDTFSFSCW